MSNPIEARRNRIAEAWRSRKEVVLIAAGEPLSIPGGADQTYPFLAHPEYFYLTECNSPGGVLAFDPDDGWLDFVPIVTEAQRVWEGATQAPGVPLQALLGWVASRGSRQIVNLGAELPGFRTDPARVTAVREQLTHLRRPKDAIEIERMRKAAAATARGFAAVRSHIAAGRTERQLQIELEAEFFRSGGDRTAFDTIVGSGPNSAVLHFSPGARALSDGELVLIDAGAECQRYAADVTRTFVVGGKFSPEQRELYDVVLRTQRNAIARCRPGVEWAEVHLAAARDIADGLVQMGVLRGKPEDLVERDAHTLFFPHGLGHMVGLGVRDAGGRLPGRGPNPRPALASLRLDLPLEPGYAITVEPGAYFIPALLNNREKRERFRDDVNWQRVDALQSIGGVRIEDNVLVTDGDPDVLTKDIPKEA